MSLCLARSRHTNPARDTNGPGQWKVTVRGRWYQTSKAMMRAVEAEGFGLDKLRLVERPVPRPGPGEILIRVKAATLNDRDLAILKGSYKPELKPPFVPGSDACGEVVEAAPGVTRFKVGDRVVPTYTQGWIDGLPTPEQRASRTLGVPLSGVLQDYVAVAAEDAVSAPAHLSDVEAATLPIAALTAWSTLQEGRVKPGNWVLVEGTGGVALFALQFAKLAGARVLALSSSEEKLARARELGAAATINYRPASVRHIPGQVVGLARVRRVAGTLQSSMRCSSEPLSLSRSLPVRWRSDGGGAARSAAMAGPEAAPASRTVKRMCRIGRPRVMTEHSVAR